MGTTSTGARILWPGPKTKICPAVPSLDVGGLLNCDVASILLDEKSLVRAREVPSLYLVYTVVESKLAVRPPPSRTITTTTCNLYHSFILFELCSLFLCHEIVKAKVRDVRHFVLPYSFSTPAAIDFVKGKEADGDNHDQYNSCREIPWKSLV